MQGQHFVVGLAAHEIGHGTGQFGANHASERPTNQIENEAAHEVLDANHLVVQAEAEVAQPALGLEIAGVAWGELRWVGEGHGALRWW